LKIALVHDWVITLGGAERCLEIFHELYPKAPLFTLVYDEKSIRQLGFDIGQVHSSFLQHFPRARKWYRKYLPLYPLAIEQFDLSSFDVILSSSHVAAKGVLTRADQLHICYCHTPVRYAWDLTHAYLKEHGLEWGLASIMTRVVLHYLRLWDLSTANRVDYFLSNSTVTSARIKRVYGRGAEVVYGPVDIDRFSSQPDKKEDYFLVVSRLVPYKKVDLIADAFSKLNLSLVIIGDGPQMALCRQKAGKNINFLGYQPDEVVVEYMSRARAFVFAAEEDLGLVPIEAQAAGTPVIAYGRGGVLDTVMPVKGNSNWHEATGIFFASQTIEGIAGAVNQFLRVEDKFSRDVLQKNARRFSREKFKDRIKNFVDEKWRQFKKGSPHDYQSQGAFED